jgi:hypothetical protein
MLTIPHFNAIGSVSQWSVGKNITHKVCASMGKAQHHSSVLACIGSLQK